MTEQPDLWSALLPVVDLFESLHIPYYVGGSVASSYSGVARATQDADVVASLRTANVPPLIAKLQDRYYFSRERIVTAVRDKKSFNLIHLETSFKIDVFVSTGDSFSAETMARRVSIEIAEVQRRLDFCSPEDIVLHKLLWYEEGNRISDRQWYDLQGVLRLQGKNLDLVYLRRLANQLDLKDLVEEALGEAGLVD